MGAGPSISGSTVFQEVARRSSSLIPVCFPGAHFISCRVFVARVFFCPLPSSRRRRRPLAVADRVSRFKSRRQSQGCFCSSKRQQQIRLSSSGFNLLFSASSSTISFKFGATTTTSVIYNEIYQLGANRQAARWFRRRRCIHFKLN